MDPHQVCQAGAGMNMGGGGVRVERRLIRVVVEILEFREEEKGGQDFFWKRWGWGVLD